MIPPKKSFHDYQIQGSAEVSVLGCTGSFRAVCRMDNTPVLMHKFRPALELMKRGAVLEGKTSPDFNRPFVTRFTDIIEAAGSAYLIEPLPQIVTLEELWRSVLQQSAGDFLDVVDIIDLLNVFSSQILPLISFSEAETAYCMDNIVLTQKGRFGLLTNTLKCKPGFLQLRTVADTPDTYQSIAEVFKRLLEIERSMSLAAGRPFLSSFEYETITAHVNYIRNLSDQTNGSQYDQIQQEFNHEYSEYPA